MTLKELVNQTYFLLRHDSPEVGDQDYPYSFVVNLINQAAKEMQIESGALVAKATLDLTTGDREVPLPTDFESAKQVNFVFAGSTSEWPMQRWPLQEFAWPISSGTGMPTHYHIEQDTMYIDLSPADGNASITLYYYTISGDLSLPETSPAFSESFHHYLCYFAAYNCKLRDGNTNQAEYFKRLFEDGKRELRRKTQLEARSNQDFAQVRMDCYAPEDRGYWY